jgi:hypothetical protein
MIFNAVRCKASINGLAQRSLVASGTQCYRIIRM